MKNYKKITKVVLAFSCMFVFMCSVIKTNVYAAGFSISAGSSTIEVGSSTTVTISTSGCLGRFDVSGGASDSFWSDGSTSKSYTISGNSVGTITVSVTASDVSDDSVDANAVTGTKSVTINVVAPTTNNGGNSGNTGGNTGNTNNNPTPTTPSEKKSSDASLSELTISEGTLSPEFKADTTEYSVTLDKDKTNLTINAKANDAKASVTGTGEQSLKAGMNEFRIECIAEDGTKRTYVLNVSVDETPTSFITYNDKKLGVVRDTSSVSVPTGFEEMKITLEGSEITAWKNPLSNLIIVYMIDDQNEKNFYLYDETSKTIISIYKPMALLGRNIAVIDIPKELQEKEGLIYGDVEVSGVKMKGWTFTDTTMSNYTLIYVMDEQGKAVYYLHEKGEDTLQLYSGQAAISQTAYEDLLKTNEAALFQRMLMILALLVTNLVTIVLLVLKVWKRKPRQNKNVSEHEDDEISSEPLHEANDDMVNYDIQEEPSQDSLEETMDAMHHEKDFFNNQNE